MPLFLIHAALMATGFLLALAGLIVAMTQRRKRWWLHVHRPLGFTAASLMILGAAAAIAAVASLEEPRHFRSPHTWIGGLTILLAFCAATLGLVQSRMPAQAAALRAMHRLAGRLVNLLAPIVLFLGLRIAEII